MTTYSKNKLAQINNSSGSLEKKLEINSLRTSHNLNSSLEKSVATKYKSPEGDATTNKEDMFLRSIEIDSIGHYNVTIKHLEERLLEKSKQNKALERELKEKTDTIKRLTMKMDRQKQEISILTDKLNVSE